MRSRGGPFVLGVTGSIGMGKSTVAEMFRRKGVPVFDADAAVRRVQGPGGAALAAIAAAFAGTVRDGVLDRTALGARVFADNAALKRLEAIIHPMVAAERARFFRRYRLRPLVVLDVPLLLEMELKREVDAIAIVSAPTRVQHARVLARPGMSITRLEAVLARQMPDADKRRRADFIIPTGRGLRITDITVRRIARALSGRFRRRTRASA